MRAESVDVQSTQYLSFFVAGEEYAVSILDVRELIQYAPVTRVPSLPPAYRGVVNLRGRVVPVLDLAVYFGLPETQVTKWTCIVMVELRGADEGQSVLGLLADSVNQVIELGPDDVEPTPPFGTRARAKFLSGMGKVNGKFVMLLKLDELLSADALEAAGRPLPEPEPAPEESGASEEPAASDEPAPEAQAASEESPEAADGDEPLSSEPSPSADEAPPEEEPES